MGVKTEVVSEKPEEIEDDISQEPVSASNEDEGVNQDKLAELKAKMASKKQGDKVPPRIVEKKKKSLNLGIIGSGQGGSRVASAFYSLGYNAIVFNTAPQDLEAIDIPEDKKYLLEYGIGGAAKDIQIGHDAAEAHRDGINALIQEELADAQVFVLCFSLGGGSGAGSFETIVEILAETGRPIVVITVLPMSTDDALTKNNSLQTLSKLSQIAQNKGINNIIVVDNAKLETIYSDVGHMDFFKVGNQAIVEPIDAFNHLSSLASHDKSMDPMEWAKVLTDGEGFCVYGEMTVENYEEETAIAEAVLNNLDKGLLASGFDLEQTKYAGALVVANENVWKKIHHGSVNYAMSLIKETCSSAEGVYRGTYEVDMDRDVVKVYSIFSGLGLPDSRVQQLKKEAEAEIAKAKQQAKTRNTKLTLDTGTDKVVSKADEVRAKIAKRSSSFGKNFASGKDFRKK